jgi:gluconate 2-dehydrogenase gamma chain
VKASWTIPPAEFFRVLLELTCEGFYSDPSGGGNRGMISWKMIGFDPKGQMP